MQSQVLSTTLVGLESILVQVEVDISLGLPGYHVVGLPDPSVAESADRVRTALRTCSHPLPSRRITVNLAPGDLRKEGPRFDLAIALGVLAAEQKIAQASLEGILVLGELALDGRLRPVRGVLSAALEARQQGLKGILVPAPNAAEASLVAGLEVLGATDLGHACRLLLGTEAPRVSLVCEAEPALPEIDLDRLLGQGQARRALEVAAAGGHHLMLIGPPGCGKTLLARCLPTILPQLSEPEALEVTRIESACAVRSLANLVRQRPFREPSSGVTPAGLLGSFRPGEVTRAHQGVLFLDEFAEFKRSCLEGLRAPLEAGRVEVVRAGFRASYPAAFTLVAAMNPCPCGFFGDWQRQCHCTPLQRQRYLARFSGPLRDRIDIHVEVPRLSTEELLGQGCSEGSAAVRERVHRARAIQVARGTLNSQLQGGQLRRHAVVDAQGRRFLEQALTQLALSARAYERVLRLARTLADLDGRDRLTVGDLAEAVHYRTFDREAA